MKTFDLLIGSSLLLLAGMLLLALVIEKLYLSKEIDIYLLFSFLSCITFGIYYIYQVYTFLTKLSL